MCEKKILCRIYNNILCLLKITIEKQQIFSVDAFSLNKYLVILITLAHENL